MATKKKTTHTTTRKKATRRKATARKKTAARKTRRVEPTPVEPKKQGVAAAPPTPILTVPKPLSRVLPPEPPAEEPKRGQLIAFDPASFVSEAWVSVTYEGDEMFVHPRAGVFVRGTTTRLAGALAVELAEGGPFRLRRAG